MKVKNPKLGTFHFMYKTATEDTAFKIAVLFAPLGALFLGVLIPFQMSSILAKVASGNAGDIHLPQFLLLIAIAAIGVISNRISFRYLLTAQARSLEKLQNRCLESLLKKSSAFFDNQMSGKLTTDVFSLGEGFMQLQDVVVVNVLPFIVNIVAGIAIVAYYSVPLATGLVVLTAVVIGTAVLSSKRRSPLRKERHEAQRKLRGYFADVITNNATVRLFAHESLELKKHKQLNAALTKKRLEDWLKVTRDGNNRILIVVVLQILFVLLTIRLVANNQALLTAGIFAFSFTISLSNKLFEISGMIRGFENAVTNAEPMIALLQTTPDVTDPSVPLPFEVSDGDIHIKNITFGYGADASTPLFEKLSLHIKAGEKVGLVGPSGGGKTTITKLLLRLMDIQEGTIEIDGQDVTKSTQKDVRRTISYVPQDPLLFHRTLHENIAYGNPLATREHIVKAAKKAHADEFVETLPEGYDTLVGERGVKLSGGQRQRVAIARAMLKNAPILILDEATSALDSESEVLIQDALWNLMKNKTAIVIAHRLSTIQKMDRILVLDKGKIVEQGTHAQLLKKKTGLYKKLWAHQSGGFLSEEA